MIRYTDPLTPPYAPHHQASLTARQQTLTLSEEAARIDTGVSNARISYGNEHPPLAMNHPGDLFIPWTGSAERWAAAGGWAPFAFPGDTGARLDQLRAAYIATKDAQIEAGRVTQLEALGVTPAAHVATRALPASALGPAGTATVALDGLTIGRLYQLRVYASAATINGQLIASTPGQTAIIATTPGPNGSAGLTVSFIAEKAAGTVQWLINQGDLTPLQATLREAELDEVVPDQPNMLDAAQVRINGWRVTRSTLAASITRGGDSTPLGIATQASTLQLDLLGYQPPSLGSTVTVLETSTGVAQFEGFVTDFDIIATPRPGRPTLYVTRVIASDDIYTLAGTIRYGRQVTETFTQRVTALLSGLGLPAPVFEAAGTVQQASTVHETNLARYLDMTCQAYAASWVMQRGRQLLVTDTRAAAAQSRPAVIELRDGTLPALGTIPAAPVLTYTLALSDPVNVVEVNNHTIDADGHDQQNTTTMQTASLLPRWGTRRVLVETAVTDPTQLTELARALGGDPELQPSRLPLAGLPRPAGALRSWPSLDIGQTISVAVNGTRRAMTVARLQHTLTPTSWAITVTPIATGVRT